MAAMARMSPALALAMLVACGSSPAADDEDPAVDAAVVVVDSPDGMIPADTAVADALAELAARLPAFSPGTDLSIAFVDLQTGERLAIAGDTPHVSASSAKAWWVAAALDRTTLAQVMPYGDPIFRNSDNSAAGSVIDLIGPNAVNTWMWDIGGMPSSALTQWSYDRTRVATNSPRVMGGDNYMTANDAVTFLGRVYRDEILAGPKGDQLVAWMTLSPNSGLGGWIPARLPAAVQTAAMHKAGYLPPGCCSDNAYYNTANDIGIVVAPDGRAYAIAILARRGTEYNARQQPFVELASCSIYRAFTHDAALDCTRTGDPAM